MNSSRVQGFDLDPRTPPQYLARDELNSLFWSGRGDRWRPPRQWRLDYLVDVVQSRPAANNIILLSKNGTQVRTTLRNWFCHCTRMRWSFPNILYPRVPMCLRGLDRFRTVATTAVIPRLAGKLAQRSWTDHTELMSQYYRRWTCECVSGILQRCHLPRSSQLWTGWRFKRWYNRANFFAWRLFSEGGYRDGEVD